MKKTMKPLLLAIALFTTLISCDKIEEATTVKVDGSDVIDFTVSLSPGQSIDETITYNLSDNTEINDYLDKVKNVQIIEAYYVLTSFSSTTQTTGSITFTLDDDAFGPFEHNLIEDVNNAKKTTLDIGKLNAASSELLNSKKLSVSVKGSHSIPASGSASEQLGITLYLKINISASPL
ncbi:MAG: hypothetical protein P8L72_01970 [Flavobacteriaceae bacterium]|nr:hypothetical protein [Flavobacteriaceae bacterium]MDG2314138.1 hypothetical protein [Flavobacteriaceae bacterium]